MLQQSGVITEYVKMLCHQGMRKNIKVEGYPWMTLNSDWSMSSTLSNEMTTILENYGKEFDDPICLVLKEGSLNNLCLMQQECCKRW